MLKLIKIFNRPLSPHLTIYSSQFTSIFSIWHRITGISLIIILVCSVFTIKITSYRFYTQIFEMSININFWIWTTSLLNLILLFSYHMINGFRHIIWDLSYALSFSTIQVSAKLLLISILLISVLSFIKIIS